jgi:integrase
MAVPGRPLRKALIGPADPPTVEEIVAIMRRAGDTPYGLRTRAVIVLLWRAGLRIREGRALAESDLHDSTGGVLVRRGKGGKRREVGMDRWGWQQLEPWLEHRITLPVGALLWVIDGPTPDGHRPRQPPARPCDASPCSPASAAASRRISSATRTLSRWLEKASAERHPTPAWPRQPRHHLDLPPRHRQQRNHQHRLRARRANAASQRGPSLT